MMATSKQNSNELMSKLKSAGKMVYKSLLPAMMIATTCAFTSLYLVGYECSACGPDDLYYMMMNTVYIAFFAYFSTLTLVALYGFFKPERADGFSFKLELLPA